MTFFLGSALCGFLFCLGTTLCGFLFCLGTTLCGFLFSLQAFLILGIDFGQVLRVTIASRLLDLESVVSGKVQEDPAAIAENEQWNTRCEACNAVADKARRQCFGFQLGDIGGAGLFDVGVGDKGPQEETGSHYEHDDGRAKRPVRKGCQTCCRNWVLLLVCPLPSPSSSERREVDSLRELLLPSEDDGTEKPHRPESRTTGPS